MQQVGTSRELDLLIIGGGINGCGIARDAAGRGLSVGLYEMGDLAQATSSGSTKLFHGGLRYLEYYEFRLVREALIERERLLKAMPHISWPMRFVLPHHKGLRPTWLLRLGLFIYDHLGGRKILPPTKTLDFSKDITGQPLRDEFKVGFEYSDCWVDDARLVMLNARDAEQRGASIRTRTKVESAERQDGVWRVVVQNLISGDREEVRAKSLVNCAGPWVAEIIGQGMKLKSQHGVRLVRGSHIVTRKLFDHDRAYIFQQSDRRIIFAIPYEDQFTLIGTTDVDHKGSPSEVFCTAEEQSYLLNAASEYFNQSLTDDDVVWTYSGVRPLYDDNASSATAATRDYVLKVDHQGNRAAVLNVFGGKITTYRKLAEAALEELRSYHPSMRGEWTAGVSLPGGNFELEEIPAIDARLAETYPFMDANWIKRMIRTYGMETFDIFKDAHRIEDLGENFGATLTEAEVKWQIKKEWAITVDDVIWRRTKLGLRLNSKQKDRVAEYLSSQLAQPRLRQDKG